MVCKPFLHIPNNFYLDFFRFRPGTGAFDTTMRYNVSDTQPLPGGPFWAGQLKPNATPIASKQLQRTTSNLYIDPTSPNALTIHADGSESSKTALFSEFNLRIAPC